MLIILNLIGEEVVKTWVSFNISHGLYIFVLKHAISKQFLTCMHISASIQQNQPNFISILLLITQLAWIHEITNYNPRITHLEDLILTIYNKFLDNLQGSQALS